MLNIGECFYEIHGTKITALGHVHLRTNSSIHLILTEFPLSQGQCKKKLANGTKATFSLQRCYIQAKILPFRGPNNL